MRDLLFVSFLFLAGCSPDSGSTNSPSPPPPHNGAYLLFNHGGNILSNTKTVAVFWGSTWHSNTAKSSALVTFLQGLGGSHYASLANEYGLSAALTYQGTVVNTSSSFALGNTGNDVQTLTNVVCGVVSNVNYNTIYVVYADTPQSASASFCAWHSAGTCRGVTTHVEYIPNLDGQADCDPGSGTIGGPEANVTAHESMETITDPELRSWYDAQEDEIGDKCAWSFPPGDYSTLSNGTRWKLQMEWSNSAFLNGTGLPNTSYQYGCIY